MRTSVLSGREPAGETWIPRGPCLPAGLGPLGSARLAMRIPQPRRTTFQTQNATIEVAPGQSTGNITDRCLDCAGNRLDRAHAVNGLEPALGEIVANQRAGLLVVG